MTVKNSSKSISPLLSVSASSIIAFSVSGCTSMPSDCIIASISAVLTSPLLSASNVSKTALSFSRSAASASGASGMVASLKRYSAGTGASF